MAFDFKKLAGKGSLTSITDPVALFDALPNKAPGYGYLRAVQKEILDQWAGRRRQRDLVIKTNTGGGKTVVGLIILQCCLNESKGPALYLAPDPHLAARVREEAVRLGIPVVDDPEASKFASGEAICVTTMATLLNGRTRFGLRGSGTRAVMRVNSIVVDDAHAALAAAEEKTRFILPANHPAFEKLLELFADDLRIQARNAYMDIAENDTASNATLRVPFWAWRAREDQVLEILRPHRTSPELEWVWPLVNDILPICAAVFTAEAFEVVPPCPPIEKFPSFAEAERRVYLTATLADDSILITHFDADPESVAKVLVPSSAADLGDRLVLAPQELNPDITTEDILELAHSIATDHNVVVLVPSKRLAARWSDKADIIASTATQISDAVDQLISGHVGLVVIVNRYDGIDLPDDACRLLIIDSLPFALSGSERREAVALRDSEAMVTRQLQRVEQGMGRAVRSRDDRCAVLLVGAKLTRLVARRDVADRLSPATQEQLKLSKEVAGHLSGATLAQLREVIDQVIDGDPGFRAASRDALLGVAYGPSNLLPSAKPLRDAYNASVAGRAREAEESAQKAVDAAINAGDERLAGWLGETHAMYAEVFDQKHAQEILAEAYLRNSGVLKPVEGIAYKKISTTTPQAQATVNFLTTAYSSGADLILGIEALIGDLAWDNSRTDEAEDALASLGRHLGFTAHQPERTFGLGSDVLWALGTHSYAVIEAKTGATAPKIWKKDINQLNGSVAWCQTEYGIDAEIFPIIVHPQRVIEKTGTATPGTRVITKPKLNALKGVLRNFAKSVAKDESYKSINAVQQQLDIHKLALTAVFDEFTEEARRESQSP
ncbi:helicase C-terminal domain-containing protein [Nocardia asteroides]|uniref:helicase C-terminal domain-containing protein n=1 Tax=Nocardia asteroides TaxID=1824 RepID=UPI001E37977B|nr:helicase C-terminal domain-containing protein [Nocardia asteroides]UGT61407.1 DEAD/DEAH box helicase family protein [Nocardia asteroides]